MTVPKGLNAGGQSLWRGIAGAHPGLTPAELATLEQACRQRDRADSLADKASEGDVSALRHEREASLAMARLIAAMRLPDGSGHRPQVRTIRGTYKPGRVSSLERARQQAEDKGRSA